MVPRLGSIPSGAQPKGKKKASLKAGKDKTK